jgi:hypothetical protein
MPLDLTDDETAALARLLSKTIDGARYPLSPRILTLKAILAKIRPEPAQNPPAAAALRAAAERQLPETRLGVDADCLAFAGAARPDRGSRY